MVSLFEITKERADSKSLSKNEVNEKLKPVFPTMQKSIKNEMYNELGESSERYNKLYKLFSETFKEGYKNFRIDAKHTYNHTYPISKEDIRNSIIKANNGYSYGLDARYKIEINKQVDTKVDDFIKNLKQNLNVKINTPFKYLLQAPIIMGKDRDIMLLSAQIEGGYDFYCSNEIICKSVLISLKKNENGKFVEVSSVKPKPDFGFRTSLEKVDNYRAKGEVMNCTYSGSGFEKSIMVNIDADGIITLVDKPA